MPVLADDFTGATQPFFIAPELLQHFRRIMFDAIADGIAERFQQSSRSQNRDVMGLEAQEAGRFKYIKPGRENLAAQEFILSFHDVHAVILPERRKAGMYHIHKETNRSNTTQTTYLPLVLQTASAY